MCSKRVEPGRDDRKFLEALHHFTVHNITRRALPARFGSWHSVWKRFWRLSPLGAFDLTGGEASDSPYLGIMLET